MFSFYFKDARCIFILIIGHKSGNMLSILNKLTLQKKLQNFVTKKVFWTKKVKTLQQQNKHKNPCRCRELNLGPLAPKADALHVLLHQRVN